jgi:alkanesulfonate monooxygenase SsuD/methylene tetrahydromethanopterin reductase-like flavin-dependent oxidoreductase (luciferase family)
VFMLRFDLRAPSTGAPAAELYQAALELAAWSESRGCISALLCEHHGSDDGYLPSPLIMASAMAARTTTLPITIAVIQLPLYDPVKLAEEMCVLDQISGGRVSYVGGVGYLPSEYEMYGLDFHRRGRLADEKLELLLRAKSGEPFEHDGRSIHVTPAPLTPGGPMVMWGGGTLAAARRAGRNGLGFFGQTDDPAIGEAYAEAARASGHEPGMCLLPPKESVQTLFVADDLDQAWEELGPYLMHDVLAYAAWNEGKEKSASMSHATTAEELRAEAKSHQIVTVEQAVAMVRAGAPLPLHPLIGGLPPELAWKYLKTVTDEVMPAVQG